MDQKANSIADIAAVLQAQEDANASGEAQEDLYKAELGEEELGDEELVKKPAPGGVLEIEEEAESEPEVEPDADAEAELEAEPEAEASTQENTPEDIQPPKQMKISWANILDAEYAEKWPESVLQEGIIFDGKGKPVFQSPTNTGKKPRTRKPFWYRTPK